MDVPIKLIDQAEQLYAEWDASGEDATALIDVIARAVMAERAARDAEWVSMLAAAVRTGTAPE